MNRSELRGEIDGFFGLFVDNLLQFVLIAILCRQVCGIPNEFVQGTILPGAALSILAGNLFYSWQARRLSQQSGRKGVTALPYGINTVSLIAFIFLVMAPTYAITGSWEEAWRLGVLACIGSGVIECLGAFFGDWLRRVTPRAALLSALAGIALTFISMGFVFRIFTFPVLALLPAMIIICGYAGRLAAPLGLPFGFIAVLVGTSLYWGLNTFELLTLPVLPPFTPPRLSLPSVFPKEFVNLFLTDAWLRYFAVIFPMGLFSIIGSLQNLESAEATGDSFPTKPSLLANGLGTLLAGFCGSPFPTTIYIGHPGWKEMGARWRYSVWNGIVIALLAFSGLVGAILALVPVEVLVGILLWIGLVMGAQAFRDVPNHHYLAVLLGFIPALAGWALLLIETTARAAGRSLLSLREGLHAQELFLDGVISLSQGFILTSSILAAMLVNVIEHRLYHAAFWCLAAALLSWFGVIHSYELSESGVQNLYGWGAQKPMAVAYLLCAGALSVASLFYRFCYQRGGE